MNATQAENLRILIRHMDSRVTRQLNMACYFDGCGTPACALGEATICDGLEHHFVKVPGRAYYDLWPADAERVFGVLSLFRTDLNGAVRISPQEWAEAARKVLAEHGYSMDDGFAAFMTKVREPLPLESAVLVQGNGS